MFRLRTAFMVFALVVPAVSASAATVGLGGGDNDPQLITDPTYQMLAELHCADQPYPITYRCALYDATEFALNGGITSIDFRLLDENNNPIAVPGGITVDPLSALTTLSVSTLFPDGFTFRLSSTIPLVCFTCVFFSNPDGDVFDPQWVSIVNVTGVPEPATLLLLGPGVALAIRRWRTRGANRPSAIISSARRAAQGSQSADC